MRSLYESLIDDDDVVLQRVNNRTLVYQVDEMLKSKTPNPELIKLLESKVAIYKVNDNRDLSNLISNYIKLVGSKYSLNWIDVSNVKDMSNVFFNSKFNGDISKWNVSNVLNMGSMFAISEFNGDISKWNVSKVENMRYMFCDSKFNGDISKWDVSRVECIVNIFRNCPIKEEYKPKFK